MYQYNCNICGLSFKNKAKTSKFCSKSCYASHRSQTYLKDKHPMWSGNNKDKKCLVCTKLFWHKNSKKLHCSKKCSSASQSKNRTGSLNVRWNGGKLKDKDGYILLLCRQHPNTDKSGYVREHRLVMEKYIGRYLTRKEVVHHINHIKDDNRIENLQLLSKNAHDSIHLSEYRKLGLNIKKST